MNDSPQSPRVPKENINFLTPGPLKREFMQALKTDPDYETATEFLNDAIHSYVLQRRRNEKLAIPLEFVSDKSSDKVQ
jgi:hypothetical protein